MKLTEPDTKIKVNRSNLQTLFNYLDEILRNEVNYINILPLEKFTKKILVHNLKTVYMKVSTVIFKHFHDITDFKANIKFHNGETLSLNLLFAFYPLPLDINFIEYELKKNLLK